MYPDNDQTKIHNLPTTPITDAEIAARYAAEALHSGRYELGVELAKLAQRAAAHEGTPAAARGARAAAEMLANPNAAQRVLDDQGGSHAPQLCGYLLEWNGQQRPCHQPIQWHSTPTLADHNAGTWLHGDQTITDHTATPAGY